MNRFIALDKPLKSTSVNSTTMSKNPSWKSFKEGKYAREHYRRQRVLPSKEMLGCSEQTTDKKARQGKGENSNAAEPLTDDEVFSSP